MSCASFPASRRAGHNARMKGDTTPGDRKIDRPAELDASGLQCPLPVLRANKALRELPAGARLRVRATDPAARQDFPAYCSTSGHVLEDCAPCEDGWLFTLRKKA